MTISGIGSINTDNESTTTSTSEVVGKQDFMNLLIAQLQHQDPLNPMDSTEFTAQLAQFTSLEELTNVNDNLENLKSYQASINNSQAVSFIGKTVNALGNSIHMDGGSSDDIHFRLPDNAASVIANIYDQNGGFIKSIDLGSMGKGDHTVAWDGKNSEGIKMPDGSYTYEILAVNADGSNIESTTFLTATIKGVIFKDGNAYLTSEGYEIPISHVMAVSSE